MSHEAPDREPIDYATPGLHRKRRGWHPLLQVLFVLIVFAALAAIAWPLWLPYLFRGSCI